MRPSDLRHYTIVYDKVLNARVRRSSSLFCIDSVTTQIVLYQEE